MNLDALTPEQQATLIAAFAGAIAAILTAIGYLIRSVGKVQTMKAQTDHTVKTTHAEIERMETESDRDVTKTITGELVVERNENRDLHARLRECEVSGKEKDGIIKELRSMNTSLGEKNAIQAKLLMDSAREIEALRGIEEFQRQKILRYEMQMTDKPHKENSNGNDT
jgi:hypothetical protein